MMSKFPPYPLFLHLAGRPALVVGGGRVGLRKVAGLLAAGARVSVASVEFTAALRDLGTKKAVVLRPGAYAPALIREEPWALVFAATDSPTVNAAVLREASGLVQVRVEGSDRWKPAGRLPRELGDGDSIRTGFQARALVVDGHMRGIARCGQIAS